MTTETIQTEPYTTTTGRHMTLTQRRDDVRRFTYDPPTYEEYWTYKDERGYGPSLGFSSNRHATREEAIERLKATERIHLLAGDDDDFSPLTRSDYEAACSRANVEVMPDAEIARSYGVRYGDFTMPQYDDDMFIQMKLARRRQIALDDQERQRREAQPAPVIETTACPRCGNDVPAGLLMTSTVDGPVCPDCWHTVSDGDGYGL